MENKKTTRRKPRAKAGFDKEAVLEAVAAGYAEAFSRPREDPIVHKNITGRHCFRPGYWESWSYFKFNDMVLGALQKTPADEFIELLEVLKTDIRENGIETAASNFAHALYPKSPLYP